MNHDRKNKNSGFTLVEMLVAVFILLIALVAAFTAAQRSIFASLNARDQVIAFYLTQEAFELVKNIRDSNIQANNQIGTAWRNGFNGTGGPNCLNPNFCTIDFNADEPVVAQCDPDTTGDCLVYQHKDEGYYGHSSDSDWNPTNLERYFTFEDVDAHEIKVTVTTKWKVGVFPRSFSVNEYITKWRFQPQI